MNLQTLFHPQSVAVIGASGNLKKIGGQILNNIKSGGYQGALYPVNIHEDRILDLPVYKSISDIIKAVDLAVIAIPAPLVLAEVKNCAAAHVKNIIIISSGFGEINAAGKAVEAEIKALAAAHKINILGPNCLGLINPAAKLNATFAKYAPDKNVVRKNNVAFISQSGAIGAAVLDWAANKNIGFSYFVSLGNKAVLDENDLLEYLLHDQATELVAAYLENIGDGQRFMALASRLSKVKPVAVLLAGRTAAGKAAALSHTGSLAGDRAAIIAGLKRAGVIILEDLAELFNFLRLIKKPYKLTDYYLSIISNAGGPLVLAVDAATIDKIDLPNHLDILGDAKSAQYAAALDQLLFKKKINNLLVILTPQTATEVEATATIIGEASQKYPQKLICTSFIGGPSVSAGKQILAKYLVPNYDYPEEALAVLGKYLDYQRNFKNLKIYNAPAVVRGKAANKIADKPAKNKSALPAPTPAVAPQNFDYLKSLALLKKYQIPAARTVRVHNLRAVKYPATLKIVGPKIIHKTEQRAIFVNVPSAAAAQKLLAAHPLLKDKNNYLVAQEFIKSGQELIIGATRDQSFGPTLMIGCGGIYTEVFKDVQFEIADLDKRRALAMIKNLEIYPILAGARGQQGFDLDKLARVILQTAKLINENPEIKELDINPLFINARGPMAADIRIITRD